MSSHDPAGQEGEAVASVRVAAIQLSLSDSHAADLRRDFREALAAGALELAYQPQIDVAIGRVTAFEALLRWRHPVHGDVSPHVLVPLAEASGLLGELSGWVLERACADALTWPECIGVAVNISAASLVDTAIADIVAEVLRSSGLAAARLELEVTETVLIPTTKAERSALHQIRDAGVRIAIDDFDNGYSCLGYLLDFSFDKLKIDRSFVSRLGEREDRSDVARTIVASISQLCADLRIVCSAEGVETAEQFAVLAEAGCTEAQGFLFGRPMPGSDVAAFLARHVPDRFARPMSVELQHISFRQIAETANDIIIVTTADLDPPGPTMVYVNPAFTKLTGYASHEVIGRSPRLLQGPGTSRMTLDRIGEALRSGAPVHEKILNYAQGGAPYWLDMRIVPLKDRSGHTTHFAAIERDVTLDKRRLDELEHLADRDTLTGISNRRAFIRVVEAEIERVGSTQGELNRSIGLFIAVIDVDRFKLINDIHGHAVGDAVICGLADRLTENARRADVVSRLGGDEFAVCMPAVLFRDVEEIAERLRRIMADSPVSTPIGPLMTSVSVGVARHIVGETLSALLERADAAMYLSKRAGRNRGAVDRAYIGQM